MALTGRLLYGAITRDGNGNAGPSIGSVEFAGGVPALSAGGIEFAAFHGVDVVTLSAGAGLPWKILAGVTSPQIINMGSFSLTLYRIGLAAD